MKHQADAHRIASDVRIRVQRSLEALNFSVPLPGFLNRIEKLAATLVIWGSRMNLTAHPDDPAEMAFHIVDSLMPLILADRAPALREALAPHKRVIDLGSGAGFPGLVLAAASDALFTLCESRRKRASFLSVAAAEMGLKNVAIKPIRATPESFREFDLVVARAVGDLQQLYRIAAPALRTGGLILLYASQAQRLDLKHAASAGLMGYTRLDYGMDRAGEQVARVLAFWRKQ